MGRIRAIAFGAAVAVCLIAAGQVSGVADHRLATASGTGVHTAYIDAPASLTDMLHFVTQAVVRFFCC